MLEVAESVVKTVKTAEELFSEIESTDRLMKAAAKQLEFEKAAFFRDELGRLRQQWSDMHNAKAGKIEKPKKKK